MIRLLGQQQAILRRSRRPRVSNQLAVFAAMMLFASTQVPAPNATEVEAGSAALAVDAVVENVEPGAAQEGLEEQQQASAVETAGVSGGNEDSRGLNLSLFLFRR